VKQKEKVRKGDKETTEKNEEDAVEDE